MAGAIEKWDDTWEADPLLCAITDKFQDVGVDDFTTFESSETSVMEFACWLPMVAYITGILDYGASYALQGTDVRYSLLYSRTNGTIPTIACVVDEESPAPDGTLYGIARVAVSEDGNVWTNIEDYLFPIPAFGLTGSFSRTVTLPGSVTALRFVRLSAAVQYQKQYSEAQVAVAISDLRFDHDTYVPPIVNPPEVDPEDDPQTAGNTSKECISSGASTKSCIF